MKAVQKHSNLFKCLEICPHFCLLGCDTCNGCKTALVVVFTRTQSSEMSKNDIKVDLSCPQFNEKCPEFLKILSKISQKLFKITLNCQKILKMY